MLIKTNKKPTIKPIQKLSAEAKKIVESTQ